MLQVAEPFDVHFVHEAGPQDLNVREQGRPTHAQSKTEGTKPPLRLPARTCGLSLKQSRQRDCRPGRVPRPNPVRVTVRRQFAQAPCPSKPFESPDRVLLVRVSDHADAVVGEAVAVGNAANPLPLRLLGGEGGLRSRPDQRALELGHSVDHRAQELVLRRDPGGHAVRRLHDGTMGLDDAFEHGRDHGVACKAVTLGREEHSGSVYTQSIQRAHEAGALVDGGPARHPDVFVNTHEFGPSRRAPTCQRVELSLAAVVLSSGGDTNVADHDEGISSLCSSTATRFVHF